MLTAERGSPAAVSIVILALSLIPAGFTVIPDCVIYKDENFQTAITFQYGLQLLQRNQVVPSLITEGSRERKNITEWSTSIYTLSPSRKELQDHNRLYLRKTAVANGEDLSGIQGVRSWSPPTNDHKDQRQRTSDTCPSQVCSHHLKCNGNRTCRVYLHLFLC